MLRLAKQAVDLAVFHNLTGAQYRDALRDATHRRQVVGDKQIGQPQLLLELLKQGQNLRLHRDIQRGSRFVEDQNRRLQHQRPGNGDPLALAAGKLAGGPRQQLRRQCDPGGNRLDPGTTDGRAQRFEIFQRLFDNLKQGLTRVERGERVLVDELNFTPQLTLRLAT